MKKKFPIQRQRAASRFQKQVETNDPVIQLALPMKQVVGWLQEGVGELLRQAGTQLMQLVMEDEVQRLVGDKHRPDRARRGYRWGSESGYCLIDGQKVPLDRPRVRDKANREVTLGSYELFQRGSLVEQTVWNKILAGLTMRSYEAVVREFAKAYGLKKSTVSAHFVEASRKKLEQLLTRPLGDLRLLAIVIDAKVFRGQHLVVALGIGCDGRKTVLGLRQGATENATVVKALLGDLQQRGIDFSIPRLYLLDGSKALRAAVRDYAGQAAFVQRCQVHKIGNVVDHLPESYQPAVRYKMRRAYKMKEEEQARAALDQLLRELMEINPSAARSLEEGLDETLTLHQLRVGETLRQTLSTTNVIESSFSMVGRLCDRVKSRRPLHGAGPQGLCRSGVPPHQRPLPARQGHRRDGRDRSRRAAAPCR